MPRLAEISLFTCALGLGLGLGLGLRLRLGIRAGVGVTCHGMWPELGLHLLLGEAALD